MGAKGRILQNQTNYYGMGVERDDIASTGGGGGVGGK